MAGKISKSKRDVGGRSRSSSKEDVRSEEQDGIEDKPEGYHEVRANPFGVQGINPAWANIATTIVISALSFSASQGLNVGLDKNSVASLGLSYFLRLQDSLQQDLPFAERKKKINEIVDSYFLAVSDVGGRA